jgi:hypothetical protein
MARTHETSHVLPWNWLVHKLVMTSIWKIWNPGIAVNGSVEHDRVALSESKSQRPHKIKSQSYHTAGTPHHDNISRTSLFSQRRLY